MSLTSQGSSVSEDSPHASTEDISLGAEGHEGPVFFNKVRFVPNKDCFLPNKDCFLPNKVFYLPNKVFYLPNKVFYLHMLFIYILCVAYNRQYFRQSICYVTTCSNHYTWSTWTSRIGRLSWTTTGLQKVRQLRIVLSWTTTGLQKVRQLRIVLSWTTT